jgi:hypothetical protein
MSRCGRTAQMDALALGELSAPEALALRTHARSCQVCRHELRWAESEKALFSQRAARDEVSELWAQTKWAKKPRRTLAPAFAAALAVAVMLVVIARPATRSSSNTSAEISGELLMTIDEAALMTPASPSDFSSAELEASLGACLMMTPGHGGIACE